MSSNSAEALYVVYDGACPFCARYSALLRIRAAVGRLELVDARAPGAAAAVVAQVRAAGCDLDEGMALVRGDRIAHGAACLHELALLSTGSGLFNRLNAWIFRSPGRARALYPWLRAGRNAALRLVGAGKIGDVAAREAR